MDQQREQASQIAHEFIVYQESEQADIDAKDHQFDALWQSIYDVCKLIKFGIIEDITEEESEEEPGTIIYQSRPAGDPIIAGITLRVRVAISSAEDNPTTDPGSDSSDNNNDTN